MKWINILVDDDSYWDLVEQDGGPLYSMLTLEDADRKEFEAYVVHEIDLENPHDGLPK